MMPTMQDFIKRFRERHMKRREVLDDTPIAVPAGIKPDMSLEDRIKLMIRTDISHRAAQEGTESFEEADDFNVGDDFDPTSPYEENFDHDLGRHVTQEEAHRLHAEAAKARIKSKFEEEKLLSKDNADSSKKKEKPASPKAGSKSEEEDTA